MRKLILQVCWKVGKLMIVLFVLSFLWVFMYKFINPPLSGMMLYKWVKEENYTIENKWVELESVSRYLPLAVIAAEDQKFLKHNGFDLDAIQKAIEQNKKSKRIRGASTISQQVAKNVFLFPTKSYLRKGLEVYFTTLIELVWGKRRIMEVYVNVAEFGEGIYGVELAAQNYFNKTAQQLSKNESALIAVALPNPLLYQVQKPSSYMLKRQQWVLRQMNNLGGTNLIGFWYE